jgi:hypothetical protein
VVEGRDLGLSRRPDRRLHLGRARHRPLQVLLDHQLGGGLGQGRPAVGNEVIEVEHGRPPSTADDNDDAPRLSNALRAR